MRVPRQRIRFATSAEGKTDPRGFIVLDLKGLDIEGVDRLVLPVDDIENARAQGDQQDDAARRARELLGG